MVKGHRLAAPFFLFTAKLLDGLHDQAEAGLSGGFIQ